MKTAGIRELKQNASAVVAEVASGETVTITDRGRPVARLVPIQAEPLETLIDSGRARRARRRLSDLGAPPRATVPDRKLSDVLKEMRASERW